MTPAPDGRAGAISELGGPARWRDPVFLAVTAPAVLLAVLGWARRWAADDAYIDFRVVDNLLHGHGPVFNAGERIEAYTSPLWVALLTAVHWVLGFVNLPWTAVVFGLVLSVAGLLAASIASVELWDEGRRRIAVPVGALLVCGLPPVWDFATSGLETGLVVAWLGVTYLALVRLGRAEAAVDVARWARPAPVAVLIGLGPLIRPDLGIFSVGFLIALVVLGPRPRGRLARWRLVAWALVLPVAYQLFRMGYFAALVPNTAIAKEAGKADWSRGWLYLWNFARPYALYVPLAAAAALGLVQWRSRRAVRPAAVLALVPVACGVVHTLYVVRVGGDFMHARLLLPGLFGVLLPVMVVAPVRWRIVPLALAAVVLGWALVSGIALRYRYPGYPHAEARIVDERAFYVASARNGHPITVDDYRIAGQVRSGRVLRRRAARHLRVLMLNPHTRPAGRDPAYANPPTRPSLPNRVAGAYFAVGLVSYTAGTHVTVVDRHGLADAIGARLEFRPQVGPGGRIWPVRYRAGHEKVLPLAWVVARFADLHSQIGRRLARSRPVAEAARALHCTRLRELLRAVDAPLTFSRFVSNIGAAWRLRSFRLSPEPQRAERELCGRSS